MMSNGSKARSATASQVGAQQGGARRLVVAGRVQGVGFRPFVARLAARYGVSGFARNEGTCVVIHAEGNRDDVRRFMHCLIHDHPSLAQPFIQTDDEVALLCRRGFQVEECENAVLPGGVIAPDLSLCRDCLDELWAPDDRRYRYPFITCTQCGPRYTIMRRLPYDRAYTSLSEFSLCDECRAEYTNPADRRFHAEALGCSACGPGLWFVRCPPRGTVVPGNKAALDAAVDALRKGEILAVRGIGGYHLLCDAGSVQAVRVLRERKRRPTKPFAIMVPEAGDVEAGIAIRSIHFEPAVREALADSSRPIVIARRRVDCPLAPNLAPGLDSLGVMLPYSPLHVLLLSSFGGALVTTSGNLSGGPVITDVAEAERDLAGIADAFLHHDRAIVRPADDGVVLVSVGRSRAIRPGRGSAPLDLRLPHPLDTPVLALGGHLKATIGIGFGERVVVSPHIGDLDDVRCLDLMQRFAGELPELYNIGIRAIAHDLHPDYPSTRWARRQGLRLIGVQHHAAHASALAGELPDVGEWLVFTWDGTGYGEDGTLWGGEALLGRPGRWSRVASLCPFRLPGGDLAGRAPWRSAAALMWEVGRSYIPPLDGPGSRLVRAGWDDYVNTPASSAMGRLFDAAACVVMGCDTVAYEGEGAMRLEALGRRAAGDMPAVEGMPLAVDGDGVVRADWSMMLDVLGDRRLAQGARALWFHAVLAETVCMQALAVQSMHCSEGGMPVFEAVGLTGGVFQNRLLAELAVERLGRLGMTAHLPARVPANDAGLAFGQIVEASARMSGREIM